MVSRRLACWSFLGASPALLFSSSRPAALEPACTLRLRPGLESETGGKTVFSALGRAFCWDFGSGSCLQKLTWGFSQTNSDKERRCLPTDPGRGRARQASIGLFPVDHDAREDACEVYLAGRFTTPDVSLRLGRSIAVRRSICRVMCDTGAEADLPRPTLQSRSFVLCLGQWTAKGAMVVQRANGGPPHRAPQLYYLFSSDPSRHVATLRPTARARNVPRGLDVLNGSFSTRFFA